MDYQDFVFNDLLHNLYKVRSDFLAEIIEEKIIGRLKQPFRKIKQATFYVLANVNMPSIWIGMAYITNKQEADKLSDTKWQNQMAGAIAEGILTYKSKVENNFETSTEPTEIEKKITH
jgi:N-acetylmuramoyl-L-alanine amidase